MHKPFVAVMVVPTGTGAAIGGYGGDAGPAASVIAAACDVLITHPNVLNAAVLQRLPANALYTEGAALDGFLTGRWRLQPGLRHTLGVVFDAGISPEMLTLHHNVVNAVRTAHGMPILEPVMTASPLDLRVELSASGTSGGGLANPEVLLDACGRLIAKGATAIAIAAQMPAIPPEAEAAYRAGKGVDPIGGLEAILSHLVVDSLGVPCAHAPVFSREDAEPVFDHIVPPRTAPEFIAATFMPCVLTGLMQAPGLLSVDAAPMSQLAYSLGASDVDVLILPQNALGGLPFLAACEAGIPVLLVAENQLAAGGVTLADWRELDITQLPPVRVVNSYLEAAGACLAMHQGLDVMTSRSPLKKISVEECVQFVHRALAPGLTVD